MNEPVVSHVSDTARWVAVYRAWESARPDALFRDPYAARLAGERGRAIAQLMPRQARNGWPLIVRTRLIDDLIGLCLREGCRRVINLAAGLDTRLYRLALPADLEWIEVDLPSMVAEKEQVMAAEQPACRLRRVAADLTDAQARAALLDEFGDASTDCLVIAEGLLLYLDDRVVGELAAQLAAHRGIRWWIFDLASPQLLQLMRRSMGSAMDNAPMKFGPANGVAFFEAYGWRVRDVRSQLHEAARVRRLPWFLRPAALLPEPDPRRLGRARWSAVIRLQRPAGSSQN
jgi:methyltransferase (TIGR00027 family)